MSTKRGKYGNVTPRILKTHKNKSAAGSYQPAKPGKKTRRGRTQ